MNKTARGMAGIFTGLGIDGAPIGVGSGWGLGAPRKCILFDQCGLCAASRDVAVGNAVSGLWSPACLRSGSGSGNSRSTSAPGPGPC